MVSPDYTVIPITILVLNYSAELAEGIPMNKRPAKFVLSLLAVLIFTAPILANAQDAPPPLTEMWLVTPKAGHQAEFKKGLAAHMAFRSEHGDPRSWQSYTPLLGDNLSQVAIRYCCFEWADQDAYREWSDQAEEISAHFAENVAPHAENWEHYFEASDFKNSHWVEENGPYKFFAVTDFKIKQGHSREFDDARDKMSQIALDQGWATNDRSWLWTTTIGGPPQEGIVIPYKNFAAMDRDEDSFYRFLSKHMGDEAAAALLQQFSTAAKSSHFQIWEHQEEYSMSSDD
jgi:hypothetical protein